MKKNLLWTLLAAMTLTVGASGCESADPRGEQGLYGHNIVAKQDAVTQETLYLPTFFNELSNWAKDNIVLHELSLGEWGYNITVYDYNGRTVYRYEKLYLPAGIGFVYENGKMFDGDVSKLKEIKHACCGMLRC